MIDQRATAHRADQPPASGQHDRRLHTGRDSWGGWDEEELVEGAPPVTCGRDGRRVTSVATWRDRAVEE